MDNRPQPEWWLVRQRKRRIIVRRCTVGGLLVFSLWEWLLFRGEIHVESIFRGIHFGKADTWLYLLALAGLFIVWPALGAGTGWLVGVLGWSLLGDDNRSPDDPPPSE